MGGSTINEPLPASDHNIVRVKWSFRYGCGYASNVSFPEPEIFFEFVHDVNQSARGGSSNLIKHFKAPDCGTYQYDHGVYSEPIQMDVTGLNIDNSRPLYFRMRFVGSTVHNLQIPLFQSSSEDPGGLADVTVYRSPLVALSTGSILLLVFFCGGVSCAATRSLGSHLYAGTLTFPLGGCFR